MPPPPSNRLTSPSEGSVSDDETPSVNDHSIEAFDSNGSRLVSYDDNRITPFIGPPVSIPIRQHVPPEHTSNSEPSNSYAGLNESSSISPLPISNSTSRSNRIPPIPAASPQNTSAAQNRAPPPPPPTNILPLRVPTGDDKVVSDTPKNWLLHDSDEEITAYEGDYDTDMASGAPRKEALRSNARISSLENDSMVDETILHHSALPSLGPPVSATPRAVPPPPPSQPPRNLRQSSDMPRAPPPPPSKEQAHEPEDNDHATYDSVKPGNDSPAEYRDKRFDDHAAPIDDDPDNLYSASPPRRGNPPIPPENVPQYNSPPSLTATSRTIPRHSLEVQRTSTSARRSIDAPRLSSEQGFIAGDVDLSKDNVWWSQPDSIPPALQTRRDLIYETEESSTTNRGGKQMIVKTTRILYMDYSQTVISAQFEPREPSAAILEQHHEPPPSRLRQDQLEDAHIRFGSTIGEGASSKKETTVGNGSPQALISELLSSLPEALPPIGVRAYGALVYANLANASVQQFDEIRSGDIITFRNVRFQGHRGPMKSKYAIEVGKPDHVGIVVDWDGTKHKIKAWEQGRESKKVRIESFKLSDMRSGEARVWRVMARTWVGWKEQI